MPAIRSPSESTQAQRGRRIARAERPIDRRERSRRDPSGRRTAKPETTLERTSQTAILRTAMDTITECFGYCLEQGGDHVEKDHLVCMLDAWDLLSATSSLVARGSPHADAVKETCAEAVKACEESCEEFEGDETMTACADVCREAYEHLSA
jgi:hypothetical protein